MDRFLAILQKRIAGIPAWGWALVIGGAIVAYAYLTRGTGEQTPQTRPETWPYPDDSSPSDAGDVPGTTTPSENAIEITTNPAWVRYVTDRLVAEGLYGAVEVNNALTKVLAGIEVNQQEAAIYNVAVRRFGAPPEGAPPIVVTPAPTPTPTPTPTPKPPVYRGPARRHALPQGGRGWDKGNVGWYRAVHSNFTAEYRGNYSNVAPPNSATEKAHVAALRRRNAAHGGPSDRPYGRLIYLPRELHDNGTWKG